MTYIDEIEDRGGLFDNDEEGEKMMSEKEAVVTGGGGFIGAHASKTFANAGYDVIIIDSDSRKWATKNYSFPTTFPVHHSRHFRNV